MLELIPTVNRRKEAYTTKPTYNISNTHLPKCYFSTLNMQTSHRKDPLCSTWILNQGPALNEMTRLPFLHAVTNLRCIFIALAFKFLSHSECYVDDIVFVFI